MLPITRFVTRSMYNQKVAEYNEMCRAMNQVISNLDKKVEDMTYKLVALQSMYDDLRDKKSFWYSLRKFLNLL